VNTPNETDEVTDIIHKIPSPALILVRGLPGSGKSSLAHALQDIIGADSVVILDPDQTDYTSSEYTSLSSSLEKEGVDIKFHPYRYLRSVAYEGIVAGKIIIWNQAFTNLDGFTKTVTNLQNYATEHNARLTTLVVEVEINPETAKKRILKRQNNGGHGVSEEEFNRFINDYVSFVDHGFNIVSVDGSGDITQSAKSVIRRLV